jgi:polyhydroxyalkanoate synthase
LIGDKVNRGARARLAAFWSEVNAMAERKVTPIRKPTPGRGERAPAPRVLAPPPSSPEEPYAASAQGVVLDHAFRAGLARMTGGLSPAAMALVWADWTIHLAASPGKQAVLAQKALRKASRFQRHVVETLARGGADPCIEPLAQDRRFRGEAWRKPPYSLIWQSFLLTQQWWTNATTGVRGVSDGHERAAEFMARQMLDTVSPANFLATNPELQERTLAEGGMNLVRGMKNLIEDWERAIANRPPVGSERWKVGRDMALTPGKVVYRNRLIELIQYAPQTKTVRPEPVLIVPAWIMKYYILDLTPERSLIAHLVGQGFTVFAISWLNPGPDDRDLSMDDYRALGPMSALREIGAITGTDRVHAAGYCLGGTLLSIAAAAMARDGDDRLASISLFAAQSDFTEAGELMLFIDESQVAFLEDMMWEQGFLDARQMAGAFQLLRSNDLIWSRILHDYLMGERAEMSPMMAWNADATRMPYRMHSEYLRRLFLNNDLAEGRYTVDGRPVALNDIRAPIFAVGTEKDHIAPWRSVHKVHLFTDADVTFVLAPGGHNRGIVSPPGDSRGFRIRTTPHDSVRLEPEAWADLAEPRDGSWWMAWTEWLAERSGAPVDPPALGGDGAEADRLPDAPGLYAHMP